MQGCKDAKKKWFYYWFDLCLFASLFLCFFASVSHAREYEGFGPLPLRNQNPVYLTTLGLTPVRATVLPEGTIEGRIDSSYSNLFERGSNQNAYLDLDMEIWRLAPRISYGLNGAFEVGIEIPLLHFSGGFLDGFIQKFHSAFGLPNGGRDQVENNRFSYRFDAGGGTLINFPPADMGLSDISLHIKHQLTGEEGDVPALSWFADIKLPTGRHGRGFGNGSPDFGIGTAVEASHRRLHAYLNTAYYVTGGNDLIDGYMHSQMFAWMLAGEITLLPTWSLIVQFNGSTPLLEGTGLDEWDGVPLDLVIGFRGEEPKLLGSQDFIWQVGFSEDVTGQGPSVDFTAFISFGIRLDVFGRTRPAGDWIAKKP